MRRAEILAAAAELFAARGYHGVSIDDLGRAVGVSGPALYRHFSGKDALLAQMLVDISERLDAAARQRTCDTSPVAALDALLAWHVDFALDEPALITVHERELDNVPEPHRRRVRRLQRGYTERWVAVLAALLPHEGAPMLRARVQATFGLLNSTPHSAGELTRDEMAALLREMAKAALLGTAH